MLIGTKQQLKKVNIEFIRVGDEDVQPVSSARNLGCWFDSNMNLATHITKCCSVAFFHLRNIRRIRKFLTKECTEALVHAFITSKLDYCNSLLYGLPHYQLNKLQRVQNAAACLISNTPRYHHITPVLFDLHWLRVESRILYKILLITFKAIHHLAPVYIIDMIVVKKTSSYQLRSSAGLLLQVPSGKSLKTLGDRAFTYSAPKLWNSLPSNIRSTQSLNEFKKLLKTFLFVNSY